MAARFSFHDTLALQEVVELDGDLLLLPEQQPMPLEEARALEVAGVIAPKDSVIHKGVLETVQISDRYENERNASGGEPAWIHDMPVSVRQHVRLNYTIRNEDPLAIVPRFPHTGVSYMVRDSGLCMDLCRAFNIWRLQYIKQLGFLNQPTYNRYIRLRQSLSDHSRYLHSLDVMALGTLVCTNLGLSGEMMATGRTLFLTHDALTPAGGDSVKLVDLAMLDEDANYPELLQTDEVQAVMRKYGLREDLLLSGIRNEGLLGQVLDYVDKIAYTARDLDKCRHHIEAGAYCDQLGMKTLLNLINRYPHVCSLWDSIEVQDGQAVFTSVSRLIVFLKVRLLMFRELYYHPTARFGEFLMSRLFVKVLLKRGILNKTNLLEMTDDGLNAIMNDHFGTGTVLDTCSSQFARCQEFATLEEGEAFMAQLRVAGNVFVMLDDNRRQIKTGADLLVYSKDGPVPLRIADPGSARELAEMATMLKLVHVYYLDDDPSLSREVLAQLKRELAM